MKYGVLHVEMCLKDMFAQSGIGEHYENTKISSLVYFMLEID